MDFLKEPKRLDPREDCDVFCSFQWVGGISIRHIYRPPGSGISFGVYIRHFVLTLPNHSIVWSLLDSALFSLSFFSSQVMDSKQIPNMPGLLFP